MKHPIDAPTCRDTDQAHATIRARAGPAQHAGFGWLHVAAIHRGSLGVGRAERRPGASHTAGPRASTTLDSTPRHQRPEPSARPARTIDAQYYIWQNDITGTMLLAELEHAAQRGVRVRPPLDDNGIPGLDETLAALDAQPNFEVRLFNPFAYRTFKWANYVTDFSRLNHRMHNKSFTVDNQATIVGGRNIGDIYFAATSDVVFADLDVMAIGPVVAKVSNEFDLYWASRLAYPINRIVNAPAKTALARLHARQASLEHDPIASAYRQALADDRAVQHLRFENDVPRTTYQVYLDDNDIVCWLRWQDGTVRRYDAEPDTSWTRRMVARVLSWLPIDWLL